MKHLAITLTLVLSLLGCGDNLAAPAAPDALPVCMHCGSNTPDQLPCEPGWERSAPDQPCHVIPHFHGADAGITDAAP